MKLLKCYNDPNEWFVILIICNQKINFKLDTGVQINLLSNSQFKHLGLPNTVLNKVSFNIMSFIREKVNVAGKCNLDCTYNGKTFSCNCKWRMFSNFRFRNMLWLSKLVKKRKVNVLNLNDNHNELVNEHKYSKNISGEFRID